MSTDTTMHPTTAARIARLEPVGKRVRVLPDGVYGFRKANGDIGCSRHVVDNEPVPVEGERLHVTRETLATWQAEGRLVRDPLGITKGEAFKENVTMRMIAEKKSAAVKAVKRGKAPKVTKAAEPVSEIDALKAEMAEIKALLAALVAK